MPRDPEKRKAVDRRYYEKKREQGVPRVKSEATKQLDHDRRVWQQAYRWYLTWCDKAGIPDA